LKLVRKLHDLRGLVIVTERAEDRQVKGTDRSNRVEIDSRGGEKSTQHMMEKSWERRFGKEKVGNEEVY